MGYFDTYLGRVNRFGSNPQDRILGQMEHDFDNFVKKSPNTVSMYLGDKTYKGVLQTKEREGDKIENYFLTYKANIFSNGTIFYTTNRLDNSLKRWIITELADYETIGYNRYTVTLLEREISWIGEDNLPYTQYVHYMGEGASDTTLRANFKIQFSINSIDSPMKTIAMVMNNTPRLQRGAKVIIGEGTWVVRDFDKDSIPGVAFVTLEETFGLSSESTTLKNSALDNWSIVCSIGEEINLTLGDTTIVNFYAEYLGEQSLEPVKVVIANNLKASYSNSVFTGLAAGATTCTVSLVNFPTITQTFNLNISEVAENIISMIGPTRIKTNEILEYIVTSNLGSSTLDYTKFLITPRNSKVTIISQVDSLFRTYVSGTLIGQEYLDVYYDNVLVFSKEIEVISMWM